MPNGEIMTTAIRKEAKIRFKEGGGGGGTGQFEIIHIGET